MVSYLIAERDARGLAPAFVTPLVRTLSAISSEPSDTPKATSTKEPTRRQNQLSWTDNLLRIIHLETMSTGSHPPDADSGSMKNTLVMVAATQMLDMGATRRSALAADSQLSTAKAHEIRREVEGTRRLVESIKKDEDPASCIWEFDVTWIVARKAIFAAGNES